MELKLFNKWSSQGIVVNDLGLKPYINLDSVLVPRTFGRARKQFHKSQTHIIERLMNHLFVPGHRGRRHRLTSSQCTGQASTAWNLIKKTLSVIEEKTKKNPIEVLVKALENAGLREEITSYQMGGIIVRKAVITSPQRRLDHALRLIVQGSFQKAHSNPKGFANCLADEIIAAYNYDSQASNAIREKERIEREAAGAR